MRPFQDLIVWQKSHSLVLELYAATANFPRDEQYALTSQLRRAAASVPTNIAEGSAAPGGREFGRYLSIALGSATELEYHLVLARDLGYLPHEHHAGLDARLAEVKRMIVSLRRSVTSDRRTNS